MDFDILVNKGNIAFYNSCEVTEIFLIKKKEDIVYNFFTIAVLEEKSFIGQNHKFLGKLIQVDSEFSIGIQQYWLDINDVKIKYNELKNNNYWGINGKTSSFPKLKSLTKQFIPSSEGKRINGILKNNFHSGSYILEFFDEQKTYVDFLLKLSSLEKYNRICEKIMEFVPIDLAVIRDRVGNFIFQFPITIIDVSSNALSTWDGIKAKFSWHSLIKTPPDCLIQLESKFDDNFMGSIIEEYNKLDEQLIKIGNLDQKLNLKVWRKEPSLILSCFSGSYIKNFDFNIGVVSNNKRTFGFDGASYEVEVSSSQRNRTKNNDISYDRYISNNLYDIEKRQLEKLLSFKQYRGVNNDDALNDIRNLIALNDKNGVYLWDPYLRAKDIFKTLFYSKTFGVQLRAIASTNSNIGSVYGQSSVLPSTVISDEKLLFENPHHDNQGLNFEFRIQHGMYGWKFHDRFLIFPGNETTRPKVYALGTSVNSFGNDHNILQEVSHPQPVVDAFNELWSQLNNPKCIVWKFPNR